MHPPPPSSTQLHPLPLSWFQPLPSSIHFHLAHLSLHPALCNTLNVIRTKTSYVIGQFPQIQSKNLKLSVLPENWQSRYIRGADFESRLRILKFQPQNPFLRKFGLKKSKLLVLPESWHTRYLGRTDSASGLGFSKFWPQNSFLSKFGSKKSKFSILLENWHTEYFEDVDSYSDISFLNFQLEIHFWIVLGPGRGIACFVWCWYTWYIGVADLFQLKSVTEEDKGKGW